jgi:hypothetical protein
MKRYLSRLLRKWAARLDPPNVEPLYEGDLLNIGESYESKQVRDALVSHNRSLIRRVQ